MGETGLAVPEQAKGVIQGSNGTPQGAGSERDSIEEMAHDARNVVTALRLCAELLGEPGVLGAGYGHYAQEVGSIAGASERLVGRLTELARAARGREVSLVETPVTDLAEAVRAVGGLLSAIAGPRVVLQTACLPCAGELRLSEENLTRILLNLVRNAADAMPDGGRIRITAQRGGGASFRWTLPEEMREAEELWGEPGATSWVVLTVEDNGPGIAPRAMERIFDPGFSTKRKPGPWPEAAHQGLGLSIVRELVEAAGGKIRASSPPRAGARFEIELPLAGGAALTNVTPRLLSGRGNPDEGTAR
ncbi:MAG TPA: HAMP domain-containing sensor histidine kinase [Acidobacteriaceae bacterium]|nr:HAMP domain-containing sensor histidine kinase [Acidobacteriaceae bacterium]